MKRYGILSALVLLFGVALTPAFASRHSVKRYMAKETTANMKGMNRICLGWVDLGPDEWAAHGYDTKAQWSDIISSLNAEFASSLPAIYLPERTILAAKEKGDDSASGCDLKIKFSDVYVDYDNYHLFLSIHFIDPKTNTEIGLIPVRPYFGDEWGLRGYLNYALKEVAKKLEVEITDVAPGKK